MFNRILVVCMGNICRSPLGEAALKELLPNKSVRSAGIATKESGLIGHGAESTMKSVSLKHGFDLDEHKAQQLTQDLCDESDLILVMEPAHVDLVAIIAPNARHKTLLLGQWSVGTIDDPYQKGQQAFGLALQQVLQASRQWSQKLS
ncbi:low molecular weight protein-tyrosine-phosphatase [Vibrio coralliirubri]|uniref:low molecular weight protein-tyrosine-phosphatase n=1 Tax=Vibrio coralliirubri TaxID=1516159 RepID=UPI00069AF599|nr:low molecular weight protein-tyrosine-phosphatase [Vibrio coralliirubri]